jgi:hypothetical protein
MIKGVAIAALILAAGLVDQQLSYRRYTGGAGSPGRH